MEINTAATCGTLESNDVLVMVSPSSELNVSILSIVKIQYGDQIRKVVEDTLSDMQITEANINIDDHGALDCVIRARLETALIRASKEE